MKKSDIFNKKLPTICHKYCLIILFALITFFAAAPESQSSADIGGDINDINQAKYVFLFIGDGMGYAQRNAAELYMAGMRQETGGREIRTSQLIMNDLPVTGSIATDSLSGITDSAAAATAIATGRRTINNAVGMNPQKGEKYYSVATLAKRAGMKVGIVTSSFLQDATPAAFYGHSAKRTEHYALGLQLCESGFDYFGGGGFRNPTGRDKKGANLLDIAVRNGYTVASDHKNIMSLKPGGKAIAIHPKLSAGSMPWAIDDREPDLALSDFVKKGIELLDGKSGFFVMIEGGKIDLACHANDAATAIHEVTAFDDAIAVAVAFYRSRPKETLIVVTADHETGGMSMAPETTPEALYRALSQQKGSYAAFERTISPSAGAKITDYMPRAKNFFGGGVSTTDAVKSAFRMSMTAKNSRPSKDKEYKKLYGPYDPFTMACIREQNASIGIKWTTFYHTRKNVAVSAIGAGAELFSGEYDISGVQRRLLQAMNL